MKTSNLRRLNASPYTNHMKALRSSLRSFVCNLILVGSPLAVLALAAQSTPVFAQRGPAQRVVQGKVVDKSDAVVKGAIVYLKDTHSLAVKSFIVDDQGEYRFGQLAQNVDYELWAENNGKKSATRTISSFDSKNQFYINLKIDR